MSYASIPIAPKYDRIRQLLNKCGLDGAIVSSPENMHYTVGFAGHQHTVSRQPGFAIAVLNTRESDPVRVTTMDFEFATFEARIQELKQAFWGRVGQYHSCFLSYMGWRKDMG